MIDVLWTILKMLIALLPFLLFSWRNAKANLPAQIRSRQFLMPVVALIYCIIAMSILDLINTGLMWLLRAMPGWFSWLAGLSWMPGFLSSAFMSMSNFLTWALNGLNMDFWIFFIANAVILFVFIVVKRICLAFMKRKFQNGSGLHQTVSGLFYEYSSGRDCWFVKKHFGQLRTLLKTFYYGAIAVSVILMMISRQLYFHDLLRGLFYPVFGVILLGELAFYMGGLIAGEKKPGIDEEDEEAESVANYSVLRKILRELFGDKLLSEDTSVNVPLEGAATVTDTVEEILQRDDAKTNSFGSYMKALHETGFPVDQNFLYSSLQLLQGKSVLFNDPFYQDMIPYAFYPMNRALLRHKKALVVLGRHAIEKNIAQWVQDGLTAVTNIPFMWNVGILSSEPQEKLDVGIVTRSDVHNWQLHEANAEFFKDVEYFVLVEPSRLVTTAQIGLNSLVKRCRVREDKNIVFCACDKNCDGLVDALSHILMTSIIEVSATNKHMGTSSYMCWETDQEYLHHRLFPNISRYLGLGTEVSAVALKNQVSQTFWYGGEAFPVSDIHWIDRQYYYELMKYAGLPTEQETFQRVFTTTPDFWSAEIRKNHYMTVEDESFNMFEILRNFATRSQEQGFVNVIVSEYLLKDYMADNDKIFAADPKAIPYIVADYARTVRNVSFRLILLMSTGGVREEALKKELSLMGLPETGLGLREQVWYGIYQCYAGAMEACPDKDDYEGNVLEAANREIMVPGCQRPFDMSLLRTRERYNGEAGRVETEYYLDDADFIRYCVTQLKSAAYIAEDEMGERYYLGSELRAHVFQSHLPGQFFTFNGKYYEMLCLSGDGQVLVRRAADHIAGRPSYRQVRRYTLENTRVSEKMGDCRDISGMKVVREFADISVETPAYYIMNRHNDFNTAKRVEINGVPGRVYRNKPVLRIELPDEDGKLTPRVRYTITVLFNEIFRTLFAENQGFITALTGAVEVDGEDGKYDAFEKDFPMSYTLAGGEGCTIDDRSIYIVEDSQLDLGLLIAVERNLRRIFEIAWDYLDWHISTLSKSLNPPEEPEGESGGSTPEGEGEVPQGPVEGVPDGEEKEPEKKKGFFGRIGDGLKKAGKKVGDFFRKLFRRKKKGGEEENPPVDTPTAAPEGETPNAPVNEPAEGAPTPENQPAGDKPMESRMSRRAEDGQPEAPENEPENDPEGENGDGDIDFTTEDEVSSKAKASRGRAPYFQRYYLLYGFEAMPAALDVTQTHKYLRDLGFDKNFLKQARDNKDIAKRVEDTFKPGQSGKHYCDFCGAEILGTEFETLVDGRERCMNCGRTAVKTGAEFTKIFMDVKRNMEAFYGISLRVPIKVEMVNTKKLNRRLGKSFVPTPNMDPRVLGVAISDHNGYTLMVENGAPRLQSMMTMAHELTHIWQYTNWDRNHLIEKYGKDMDGEVWEGMAKWVEIQYAYLINEPATAKREELWTTFRQDEYGRGFVKYLKKYPFSLGNHITGPTPFDNKNEPL